MRARGSHTDPCKSDSPALSGSSSSSSGSSVALPARTASMLRRMSRSALCVLLNRLFGPRFLVSGY